MGLDETTIQEIESVAENAKSEALVQYLGALPAETEWKWELRLTRLIEKASNRVDDLSTIYQKKSIEDEYDSEFIRFAAFFACCTYHRRQGNVSKFGSLLRSYNEFETHPMFPHLKCLYTRRIDTQDSHQNSINYARKAVKRVGSSHPGISHSLALSIADALEWEKTDTLDGDRDLLLDEAEKAVERAVGQSDYPRFIATHGRILALRGEYDGAIRKIHRAVDMEDDSRDDYTLQINRYRSHEFRIFHNKHTNEISQDQQEIREKQETLNEEIDSAIEELDTIRSKSETRLREIQTQTLQFLGFFATLLAVIVSSINITTSFPLPEAASLILVLTGGLLAAFGGFTIVLPIDDVERKSIALFVMGTVLSGVGMTIVLQL